MTDPGLLVGSGTFRVDRERALEKLKAFQLPDPDMFLLPWIRCAVASGATTLVLDLDSSKIRFNGRRFTREELADPYGCLFEEAAPERARNRHLAYALLATLSRGCPSITLTTGPRRKRLRLTVKSLTEDSVESIPANPEKRSSAKTIVVLWWSHWTSGPLSYSTSEGSITGIADSVQYALDRHIAPLISIQVSPAKVAEFIIRESVAKEQRPQPGADNTLKFRKGPLACWFHVPGRLNPTGSRLRLAHFGVFVEDVERHPGGNPAVPLPGPLIPVEGTINDDDFELNISQSGVVRNERYNAVMQEGSVQAEELLSRVSRAQARRMQVVGRLIQNWLLRRAWSRWLRMGEEAEAGGFWSLDLSFGEAIGYALKNVALLPPDPDWKEENLRRIWETARATAWLRHLCARSRKDQRAAVAGKAVTDLMRAAPIFWNVKGTLLSMADLEKTLHRLGYVPVSAKQAAGSPPPYPVVWAWCGEERAALDKIFPGLVADITEAETVKGREPQSGLLEQVGRFNILIRGDFDTGRAWGEVCLPMLRDEGAARLLCLYRGEPAGVIRMECGLSFVAAVDITKLVKNPLQAAGDLVELVPGEERQALEKAVLPAARSLYRKLAEEVSDTVFYWDLSPRERAILPHLQDFLVWRRARPSGQASEEGRWIEAYPLFFTNTGRRWSFSNLREFVDAGQAVFLQPGVDFEVMGEGRVALRGVDQAFLVRLFPDAVFEVVPDKPGIEAVPDKPGVMRMTRPVPAPAEPPPLTEKPIVPVPAPAVPAPDQAIAQPAPPHPVTPPALSGSEMLDGAAELLEALRGRRGMKLIGARTPALRLAKGAGDQMLAVGKKNTWTVNETHPLVRTVGESGLPKAVQAAYLASLVYTSANRTLRRVTDQDDVKFQQALADHVAEKRDG